MIMLHKVNFAATSTYADLLQDSKIALLNTAIIELRYFNVVFFRIFVLGDIRFL